MTQSTNPTTERAINIEQLILLHEEILALVRADVPLDAGLQMLGADLPGRLGRIANLLSASINQGRSLGEALDHHASQFPPVYRSVVRAGLRSGRLTLALESLSVALSRARDARDSIMSSMVYPLVVIFMTLLCSVFFLIYVEPSILGFFDAVSMKMPVAVGWIRSIFVLPELWIPLGLLFVVALFTTMKQSKRTLSLGRASALSGLFSLLPWSRRLMRASRSGMFVEILALLLKSQIPLGEALQLAGGSVGDPRLVAGCQELSEKINRGETIPANLYRDLGLPPLASWALVTGQREGDLVELLNHAGKTYQLQADSVSVVLREYMPVLLTGLFAGGAVFLYVLWLFLPYVKLLTCLS